MVINLTSAQIEQSKLAYHDTLKQIETERQKLSCENRTYSKYEDTRIFCSRANDWISQTCCLKCDPVNHERVSQEW